MQVEFEDLCVTSRTSARLFINKLVEQKLKSKPKLSGDEIVKIKKTYSEKSILNSEEAIDVVESLILGAITAYHEQLRQVLLEQSIDIGEIDYITRKSQ